MKDQFTLYPKRAARIQISSIHNVKLWISKDGEVLENPVVSVSSNGIGILLTPISKNLEEHDILEAKLEIDNSVFKVSLKVVSFYNNTIGCRYNENPEPDLLEHIKRYFYAEILGLNLIKVDPELISGFPKPLVYSDGQDSELLIYIDNNNIGYFHIEFFGHFIDWTPERGSRYGVIVQNEGQNRIHFEDKMPNEIPELASRIVVQIIGLDPAVKKYLLETIIRGNLDKNYN